MANTQLFETFEISSKSGMRAEFTNYGARLMKLFVKDKNGEDVDVLIGFDSAEEYANDHGTYFGAVVGRVANRIEKGSFSLGGKTYRLALNDNGKNHLHGGNVGFDKRFFKATIIDESSVAFEYTSKDGEEGYPGELCVLVTYTLLDEGALLIEYSARSSADTLCALTNHAYFNLDGDGKNVEEHEIFISADSLTVVNDELIPTGERLDLSKEENKKYAFNPARPLGEYLNKGEGGLIALAGDGYDFSYNFDVATSLLPRASAYSKKTGIKMDVYTDLPAMQFYTGNFLDGFKGKGGATYDKHAAFCMETQCDIADIGARTLAAGELYRAATKYAFAIK